MVGGRKQQVLPSRSSLHPPLSLCHFVATGGGGLHSFARASEDAPFSSLTPPRSSAHGCNVNQYDPTHHV